MNKILLVHSCACWFMTGVIWLVQVLIYPLFQTIGENEFKSVHQFHMRRITWIVVPAMIIELATGAYLLYVDRSQIFLLNFISIIFLWSLTALINVPTHEKLTFISENSKIILIQRNWPRTIIWSLRSLFLMNLIQVKIVL